MATEELTCPVPARPPPYDLPGALAEHFFELHRDTCSTAEHQTIPWTLIGGLKATYQFGSEHKFLEYQLAEVRFAALTFLALIIIWRLLIKIPEFLQELLTPVEETEETGVEHQPRPARSPPNWVLSTEAFCTALVDAFKPRWYLLLLAHGIYRDQLLYRPVPGWHDDLVGAIFFLEYMTIALIGGFARLLQTLVNTPQHVPQPAAQAQ